MELAARRGAVRQEGRKGKEWRGEEGRCRCHLLTTDVTTLARWLSPRAAVGKSSILLRFTDNTFNDQQPSTIGVDFKVKMVELNGTKIKATIWDTAVRGRHALREVWSTRH